MDPIAYALAQQANSTPKQMAYEVVQIPEIPATATSPATDLPYALTSDGYFYYRIKGAATFKRVNLATRVVETRAAWPGSTNNQASTSSFNFGAMSVVLGTTIYVLTDGGFYTYDHVGNVWTTKTAYPTNAPVSIATDGTFVYADDAQSVAPKKWNGTAWVAHGAANFGNNTSGQMYTGDTSGHLYTINAGIGCQIWDSVSQTVTTKAIAPWKYYGYLVAADQGKYLYLVGGNDDNTSTTIYPQIRRLDIAANTWAAHGPAPGGNSYTYPHAASLLPDGSGGIIQPPANASSYMAPVMVRHKQVDAPNLGPTLAYLAAK